MCCGDKCKDCEHCRNYPCETCACCQPQQAETVLEAAEGAENVPEAAESAEDALEAAESAGLDPSWRNTAEPRRAGGAMGYRSAARSRIRIRSTPPKPCSRPASSTLTASWSRRCPAPAGNGRRA